MAARRGSSGSSSTAGARQEVAGGLIGTHDPSPVAQAIRSDPTAPGECQSPALKSAPSRGRRAGDSMAGEHVLGRYSFGSGRRRIVGEGAYSVCHQGVDLETGESVAIKEYKLRNGGRRVAQQKFERQVEVLLKLQEPFHPPADTTLWSEEIVRAHPSDLFVRLLDYSKDVTGKPGPDPGDGSMYIVTEFAERTLKAELEQRREMGEPLSAEQVCRYTADIVLASAGLHARGFVHMDLKPDNIAFCKGRWKLIDMDGCAEVGATILPDNDSLSFSPCYCAPEFASFFTTGSSIEASPSLDAWSVGMTLAELIGLRPLLQHAYQEKGAELFLQWLGDATALPSFRQLGHTDRGAFFDFLEKWLLVVDRSSRRTLAECLSAPYLAGQCKVEL